jgi:hypothetical protein
MSEDQTLSADRKSPIAARVGSVKAQPLVHHLGHHTWASATPMVLLLE